MKAKWNILMIFTLLATLAGGTTGTVLAQGEPVINEVSVDFEPSIVGFPLIDAFATFTGAGTSFTCTVDYGDAEPPVLEDGTVTPVAYTPGTYRCDGPAHTYMAVGTYPVTFTVTDVTVPETPLSASTTVTHVVVPPYGVNADISIINVAAPENAASAPDNLYATFGATGGTLALVIGSVPPAFVTDASLTIYHTSTGPACQVSALMPTASSGTPVPVLVGSTVRGATSTTFTMSPYFLYLEITCPAVKKGGLFGLDAIQVAPLTPGTRYGAGILDYANVASPDLALLAPDGKYATLSSGSAMALMLAARPVGFGRLTVYHSKDSQACTIIGNDPDMGKIWPYGTTTPGATASVFTIMDPITVVWFDCNSLAVKGVFSLDAVKFEPVTPPAGYAVNATWAGSGITYPNAAIWAPDGQYAQITSISSDPNISYLQLDMGAQVSGTLTFYHTSIPGYCMIFVSVDAIPINTSIDLTDFVVVGATRPNAVTSTFTSPAPFRYATVVCIPGTTLGLDAVQVAPEIPKWYAATFTMGTSTGDQVLFTTGAPDGQYGEITGFTDPTNPIYLQLDMGAQVSGTLTFYHTSIAGYCLLFASVDAIPLDIYDLSGYIAMGATRPNAVTSIFTSPAPFRYISVACMPGTALGLDAVEVAPEMPKQYATRPVLSTINEGIFMTGAPDGQYGEIPVSTDPANPIYLQMDMGAPVNGMLTIYHTMTGDSCLVESIDVNGTLITYLGAISKGATSTTFYVPDDFQYFQIECLASTTPLEVDALEVVPGEIQLDGYAFTYFADDTVKNPAAALGAPDGSFATVPAGSSIGLDLGTRFTGLLTITHSGTSPACTVIAASALDPSKIVPVGTIFILSNTTFLEIAPGTFPDGVRYVQIDCREITDGTLDLDAVGVHPTVITGYGQQVLYISGIVKNANYALGAHDGLSATIGAPGGEILLYVGELAGQPLTIYHSATNLSCAVYGVPLDLSTFYPLGVIAAGVSSTTLATPPGVKIAYIDVQCSGLTKKQTFQLDALEFTVNP